MSSKEAEIPIGESESVSSHGPNGAIRKTISRLRYLRVLLPSVSLAILSCIPCWKTFHFAYSQQTYYYRADTASPALLIWSIAFIFTFGLAVFVFAGLPFYCLKGKAQRIYSFLLACCSVALLVLPTSAAAEPRVLWPKLLFLGLLLIAGASLASGKRRIMFQNATQFMEVLALTFASIAVIGGVVSFFVYRRAAPDRMGAPNAPVNAAAHSNRPISRLVWIVFDELDHVLAMSKRPSGVEMRELDRLASSSLVASNAHASSHDTKEAVASYLLGFPVGNTREIGASRLDVQRRNSDTWTSVADVPNIFSKARAQGLRTSLIGWYQPYCRLYGNSTDECFWSAFHNARSSGFKERVFASNGSQSYVRLWKWALADLGVVPAWWQEEELELLSYNQSQHLDAYRTLHRKAVEHVSRPDFGFVFVHYNIPHPPGIYARTVDDFSTSNATSYLDNLALVDRTLSELRGAIESSGLSGSTTLLVTADHPFRDSVWAPQELWIPTLPMMKSRSSNEPILFLLHLPDQATPAVYDMQFNAVAAHGLALAVMEGKVKSTFDAIRSIEEADLRRANRKPESAPH